MPRQILRAVFLLALLAGTLGVAAPALAVDTPFSVRYAQTLRGSINAVGNQLLTCPAAATGCTAARNRMGPEATMRPRLMMATSSQTSSTRSSWWELKTTVVPAAARSWMISLRPGCSTRRSSS